MGPAAHTPDVDTLVEKLTIALTWVPWDRRREADAALSDLAARARLADAQRKPFSTTMREMDRADRLASRVAELEAALRTVRDWIREGKGTESEAAEAMDSALAGDGGGAPTDPWASYGVTNNPDDVGDGGGA